MVEKRTDIKVRPESFGMSLDEKTLIDWVREQEMFSMPLDDLDDEYILKIAETLIKMYGDEILLNYYKEKKRMTKLMKI